jgi:type II secretory pathway component PulC
MQNLWTVFLVIASWCFPALAKIIDAKKMVSGEEVGLAIMGSIMNTNKADSVALIKETQSGKVKAVKPGHKILDDKYVVTEVSPKYLVVKDAGSSDQMLVYVDKFAGEFKKTAASAPSTPSSYAANLDTYKEDGFERKEGKVSMTAAYRDKIVNQDLSKILMDATALPNYENGQIKGFRLLQITPGSIFDNAGFKDDDVITSINGKPLKDIPGTIKMLHGLKGETAIDIEISRGGSFMTMNVNVGT